MSKEKVEIPDWIYVDSHTSISPNWRALCGRCQARYVGKLRDCKKWAETHATECKGATCDVCGTVYQGCHWDNCPKCNESGVASNREFTGLYNKKPG